MSAEPVIDSPLASRSQSLLNIFRPSPPADAMVTDPAEIAAKYRRWQTRVLIFSIVGYATFYFVRKNLGIAMP
jgi:OPA family sugar phosphate sensor protein UhpC-like MFS transporter